MTFLLRVLLITATLVTTRTYPAHALEVSGTFIQGGLATGKVEPGTKLTLDGQPVAVAPDGSFIIGFGRKAKAKMVLRAEPPEGLPETRELAIEKRKYKGQRILNGQPRSPHNGVDVAAPRGTPVKTMGDGIVALVNEDMFFTGKTVMIDHGLGLTSVYVHMDKITVKGGDFVTKGMQIGTVGATGRVTGPHLHWGVSWFKTHLDPALLVGPQKPNE